MEISDIKRQLTLSAVLHHYNLKPDKNLRLCCPFHPDKTPSMQVYYKTHTAYCFSSNCKTHGKSLDVIDFVMYKEGCSKHEALEKCKALLGETKPVPTTKSHEAKPEECHAMTFSKTQFLNNMFTYFKNAVCNSKPAQEYIKQRGLDPLTIEVGYNTAQFHHGARRDETMISNAVSVGLLSPWGTSKTSMQAYKPFAKYCISFALRNRAGEVAGLYFRSTINDENQKHFYLKDRSGLYPCYPKPDTQTLILTESVIDAASLLQYFQSLPSGHTELVQVLACYGTNGLTDEHLTAIKELNQLKEIIFAFDNDQAGNTATEKYSNELKQLFPETKFSKLDLPCKDVNETLIAHQPEVFTHLIENRINLFSFSSESSIEKEKPTTNTPQLETRNQELETSNPYKLRYQTPTANYYIQGGITKIMDSMKITLVVENPATQQKSRNKIDLYEDKQVEKLSREVSEKLSLRKDLLEVDIYKLTDLLDEYRDKQIQQDKQEATSGEVEAPLTAKERQQTESFLKQQGLIPRLNEMLGKSGIAGEETNRIFLLVIAISYKMAEPLHALIQGSSGSGKTKLLRQISDCMPPERVLRLTRVSDKGFYNYPQHFLRNKLVSLEDIDGLGEEAEFAFRELQSNGELNSATSIKLDNGQITSGQKTVKGPIASLACTTRGEIYEDNMSRVFLIAVDESPEQTRRIIKYQNNKAAGMIDTKKEQEIKRFIQNLVRELKPLEVQNPYANKIQLPEEAHKIRRLNDLFQSFVKMTTVINQYQRKRNEKGKLITEIEDIETAVDIMFESIVLKVDELDGSLRQFYEKLKSFVSKRGKDYEFTRFEVREATGTGKTQQHFYISKLLELEYIQQYGFANRGFKYKIVYWDNYKAIREKIKQHLHGQLEKLKTSAPEHQPNANRTPEVSVRQSESVETE